MFDPYITKSGRWDPNWKPQCVFHTGCVKRRGATEKSEAQHGIIGPLAFLQCWHVMRWPTKATVTKHNLDEPTDAEVNDYLEEHRADLHALLVRCNR